MKRIVFVLVTVVALFLPSFAAEQLSPQQLASLVASAKTTVEHERIANYYREPGRQAAGGIQRPCQDGRNVSCQPRNQQPKARIDNRQSLRIPRANSQREIPEDSCSSRRASEDGQGCLDALIQLRIWAEPKPGRNDCRCRCGSDLSDSLEGSTSGSWRITGYPELTIFGAELDSSSSTGLLAIKDP